MPIPAILDDGIASSLRHKNKGRKSTLVGMIQKWLYRHNECLIWCLALAALYWGIDPTKPQSSLCLFHWMGFRACPGCGLGHSIHAALHGNWAKSWEYHWFGLPALGIIIFRIVTLVHTHNQHYAEHLPGFIARSAAGRDGRTERIN
jgi:hypothetical protein